MTAPALSSRKSSLRTGWPKSGKRPASTGVGGTPARLQRNPQPATGVVRDERSRFPPDCSEPRRGGGRLAHGDSRLSCGRQDLRHPRVPETGLRQLDAHAGATGGLCGRVAGSFPAHPRRMGKNGNDAHSPGESERGRTDRSSAHSMEAQDRKKYEVEKEEET